MCERIGSFPDDDTVDPYLAITLHFVAADWSLCHRTASFVAACVAARCPENDRDSVVGAVDFTVNELLENAVKFGSVGDIQVAVGITRDDLVCHVENQVETGRVSSLRDELSALTRGDPDELLRRRAERNAEGGGGAGLGFLSIMLDYGARIGWRLKPDGPDTLRIQTMARLPIHRHERKE